MPDNGKVTVEIRNGIGTISFFHPKKNSLPGAILRELATQVIEISHNDNVRVVVLRSEGDGPFCAGASFDELLTINDFEQGKAFFMGFAHLILAMKRCPKFIISRIHGKAVGGGVGVAAAADYALAVDRASIKLSELALGIGPFVVGPVVEKKIGAGPFKSLAIDADWRNAVWAKVHGLYVDVFNTIETLDAAIEKLTERLAEYSPEAMAKLKQIFWEHTDHWDQLLEERAAMSGQLVLSDFTSNAIAQFKSKR